MWHPTCPHCGAKTTLSHNCLSCTYPLDSKARQQAWLAGYNAAPDAIDPYPMIQVSPTEYISAPGSTDWWNGQDRARAEQRLATVAGGTDGK